MFFKTRKVFVSHSSNEDALASNLLQQLSSRGLKPFVDHYSKTGIVPGEDWLAALRGRLRGTQAVVILVSEAWRLSPWCQAEYRTAKLLNKAIIPVIIGNVRHDDVEPSLQKIFIQGEASEIPAEVIDAIVRALPSRLFINSISAAGLATVLVLIAMGIDRTKYGRWELKKLRGGAFVDLAPDPAKDAGIFALAVNTLGRQGLFSSGDCGNTWSEIRLPDDLVDPIGLTCLTTKSLSRRPTSLDS